MRATKGVCILTFIISRLQILVFFTLSRLLFSVVPVWINTEYRKIIIIYCLLRGFKLQTDRIQHWAGLPISIIRKVTCVVHSLQRGSALRRSFIIITLESIRATKNFSYKSVLQNVLNFQFYNIAIFGVLCVHK